MPTNFWTSARSRLRVVKSEGAVDELATALITARRVLDTPHADPDADLSVLSRQLTQLAESVVDIIEDRPDGGVRFSWRFTQSEVSAFLHRVRDGLIRAHTHTLHHDD